ncbi:hypothetical protein [Marinobacter salinus]|uniref:hypothetical protein n=1 Tax=Marinobacter salinus TaxID=1874317 RepID=UPI0012FD2F39|nr:hypothetical protein [Marinobacter salinus]
MKKVIIAAAIIALFPAIATANSGLADRINEASSYPNKSVNTNSAEITIIKDKEVTNTYGKTRKEAKSKRASQKRPDHAHS